MSEQVICLPDFQAEIFGEFHEKGANRKEFLDESTTIDDPDFIPDPGKLLEDTI